MLRLSLRMVRGNWGFGAAAEGHLPSVPGVERAFLSYKFSRARPEACMSHS